MFKNLTLAIAFATLLTGGTAMGQILLAGGKSAVDAGSYSGNGNSNGCAMQTWPNISGECLVQTGTNGADKSVREIRMAGL